MKTVIICAALLVAICGAGAQPAPKADRLYTEATRNGFDPAPRPLGLPTYTREWPKLPVLEEHEAQWDYTPDAPNWRYIRKSPWR